MSFVMESRVFAVKLEAKIFVYVDLNSSPPPPSVE